MTDSTKQQKLSVATPELRSMARRIFNDTCQYCGYVRGGPNKVAGVDLTFAAMTLDRIVPQARGGIYSFRNVTLACVMCNSKKGTKLAKPRMTLMDALFPDGGAA